VAGLLLEFYDQFNPAPGSRIGFAQQTLLGVNDWTRVLINGVTPPNGTVMVRVFVFTYALQGDNAAVGGTVNFDDVIFSYDSLPQDDLRTTVLNSGFENGLNFWSDLFGFPAETSNVAHSGTLSAKKDVGVITGQDYFSQLYQDIYYTSQGNPFPTGIPIYATAFVKTDMDPVTKSKAGLQLEFIDANGDVITDAGGDPIVVSDSVGGQTNWRYLFVNAPAPAGTYRVRLSGFEFAREQDAAQLGTGYYDDFKYSVNVPLIQLKNLVFRLRNGGFENGLNDWDEENKPGEVTTTVVFSGNYAAYFEIDSDIVNEDYFGTASQVLPVKPGQSIDATVMAKTTIDPLTNSVAVLSIAFLNAQGQQIGAEITDSIGGNTNWTQLQVLNAIAPPAARQVKFTCALFGAKNNGKVGDRAYFDQAKIQ